MREIRLRIDMLDMPAISIMADGAPAVCAGPVMLELEVFDDSLLERLEPLNLVGIERNRRMVLIVDMLRAWRRKASPCPGTRQRIIGYVAQKPAKRAFLDIGFGQTHH